MRTADIVCALILLGLAVVVIVEGLRLGIGWSTDGPRPGFFVFYLGLALLVSSSIVALQAHRRAPGAARFVTRARLASVATVLVPAIAAVAATHLLGLYVSGALYLGGYMRWIGRHSWLSVVLLAVAVPLATFFIFEVWFLVPLPKGPLEARLGF